LSPHDIRLQRLIDAPIDEAFHHWTDSESRRRWCAPDEAWFAEAESDLRIGGTWSVWFGPTAEAIYRVTGVYEEIDQPNRLVYSSVFRYPDGRSFETRTTVTFEARAGQTLLKFIDAGYPDEEDISVFEVGTLAVLDFFEQSVESPAAGGRPTATCKVLRSRR
jgi:uncharacterized protein YndB with AHSA1/START domain